MLNEWTRKKSRGFKEVILGLKYESWVGNSRKEGVRRGKECSIEGGEWRIFWDLI